MACVVFEQTIKSLSRFKDFANELKEMFQTQGIYANTSVIEQKSGMNYVYFPDGALLQSLAYLNRIPYDTFSINGAPLLHFCACEEFQRLYNAHNPHLLLVAPKRNAFEFSVYRGNSVVGWYTDTPLRFCPMCKEIFLNLWHQGKDVEFLHSLQSILELPVEE